MVKKRGKSDNGLRSGQTRGILAHSRIRGDAIEVASLPPFVFRIFALQFRLELGVGLPPDDGQIFGHLDRALIGREHFDADSYPPAGNR